MDFNGLRIQITLAQGGGGSALAEIKMRSSSSSTVNMIVNAGPLTVTDNDRVGSSKTGVQAFDDDPDTYWQANDIASDAAPIVATALFTNNLSTPISDIGIRAVQPFASLGERAPSNFTIELRDASNNQWLEVVNQTGESGWMAGMERWYPVTLAAAPSYDIDGGIVVPLPTLTGEITTEPITTVNGGIVVPVPTLEGDVTFAPQEIYDVEGGIVLPVPTLAGSVDYVDPSQLSAWDVEGGIVLPLPTLRGNVSTAPFNSNYALEDRLGNFYELTAFRPSQDEPGDPAPMSMARPYKSSTVYTESLDFFPVPSKWMWKGIIEAANKDELEREVARFKSFSTRVVRVWRKFDMAWIDLRGMSRPIVVDPVSNRMRDVTFSLAVADLFWQKEFSRTYGEGLYGEGIYAGGGLEQV